MEISFDPAKRQKTLDERGLDFADAFKVFQSDYVELVDDRHNYGEERYLAFGVLDGRPVCVVWTPRNGSRRIISMRHAHDEEVKERRKALE